MNNDPVQLTDLDRRIWEEELDRFVPQKVFDVHTHVWRWGFNLDPGKETGPYRSFVKPEFEESSWKLIDRCDELLMPGREVHRLSFPFPFKEPCDFRGSNEYIAGEVAKDPQSAALMLVRPSMTAEELEETVRGRGFLGFKPYRMYSITGDVDECRITDFLPEHQIEVAHRLGLIIMMHVSKRQAIADEQNIADIVQLSHKYPRAKWILAHCARSYSNWAIERAAERLRGLPNVWYDVSSVCESDAIEALVRSVGIERVMYGSDDVPVGILRGKYIAFGRAWAYLSPENHALNLSHCDGRMTFTRYEQLRAMKRAVARLGLSRGEIDDLFCNTAVKLVNSVRTASVP